MISKVMKRFCLKMIEMFGLVLVGLTKEGS